MEQRRGFSLNWNEKSPVNIGFSQINFILGWEYLTLPFMGVTVYVSFTLR